MCHLVSALQSSKHYIMNREETQDFLAWCQANEVMDLTVQEAYNLYMNL